MKTIETKQELAEFFRDHLLPYYEKHYRDDLTLEDALELGLDVGICTCARRVFKVDIYDVMGMLTNGDFLFDTMRYTNTTPEQALIPRIEWMKNFINENLK